VQEKLAPNGDFKKFSPVIAFSAGVSNDTTATDRSAHGSQCLHCAASSKREGE